MPIDRTYDISNTAYHVKDVKALGKILTDAGSAAFPNRGRSRYREAHVLLLSWEDDNLGVINEVTELEDVFRQCYSFGTEEWKIPSKRPHNTLASKILEFSNNHEGKDSLLIVYYGGHGLMNDDRQCIWSCTENADSAEVRWYAIQTILEEAQSDVLVLLDCCAAASSATGAGSGITEMIAACGFETEAPSVGEHSFTRSLIEELKYLRKTAPFSTALLHNTVLARVKYWKPRYGISASDKEKRRTPVYAVLSNQTKQPSIEIAPIQACSPALYSSHSLSQQPVPQDDSESSQSVDEENPLRPSQSSKSPLDEVWPDSDFRCPKVLISVALEEDQWLSSQQWEDWLRSIPGLVRFANVEGVYGSDSTLLLSMPVAVWNLIPAAPATAFIGISRTDNLMKPAPHARFEWQDLSDMPMPTSFKSPVSQSTVSDLGSLVSATYPPPSSASSLTGSPTSGERPSGLFVTYCQKCNERFTGSYQNRTSNLNRHLKSLHHEGELLCPDSGCGDVFGRSNYLAKHRRKVHNIGKDPATWPPSSKRRCKYPSKDVPAR